MRPMGLSAASTSSASPDPRSDLTSDSATGGKSREKARKPNRKKANEPAVMVHSTQLGQ